MKNNKSTLIFSIALLFSAILISVSLFLTAGKTAGSETHRTIVDEHSNTYVIEKEDPVKLTVITDATCETCQTDRLEAWLKTQIGLPFAVRRLDYNQEEAREILTQNQAEFLPYILMDKQIEKLPNFGHLAHHVVSDTGEYYLLDLMKIGAVVTTRPGTLKLPWPWCTKMNLTSDKFSFLTEK